MRPSTTIEILPVSSDTTTATASVSSVIPSGPANVTPAAGPTEERPAVDLTDSPVRIRQQHGEVRRVLGPAADSASIREVRATLDEAMVQLSVT